MANAIATLITSLKLSPALKAAYLRPFLKEVKAFDYSMWEKYADKQTIPGGNYGDTRATGDTGGDAARTAGLYTGHLDGFKITGWDDIGYVMNYGFRLDDMGAGAPGFAPTDLYADIDYNFTDFEIAEGTGYANDGTKATNYRAHDKPLTNKFYINVPIVRFGATNQYEDLAKVLATSDDFSQLMKQFGTQAKMVQAQYIRATLINEATQMTPIDMQTGGTVQDIYDTLIAVKQQLKLRRAEKFTEKIAATDAQGAVSVRPSYIGIMSTQFEEVMDEVPEFNHVDDYPNSRATLPNEYGTVKKSEIRFIENDVLCRQSGTSSVGIVDVMNGANLEVYNLLVMGKNAYTIATLQGRNRYQLFVDPPGKGNDTLRLEHNTGWKVHLGAKVHRPAWMYNIQVKLPA